MGGGRCICPLAWRKENSYRIIVAFLRGLLLLRISMTFIHGVKSKRVWPWGWRLSIHIFMAMSGEIGNSTHTHINKLVVNHQLPLGNLVARFYQWVFHITGLSCCVIWTWYKKSEVAKMSITRLFFNVFVKYQVSIRAHNGKISFSCLLQPAWW